MSTNGSPALVLPKDVPAPKESQSKRMAPVDHANDATAGTRQSAKRPGIVWILMSLVLFAAAMGGLFYLGWQPSEKKHAALNTAAGELKNTPMRVSVIAPQRADPLAQLVLPGEIQAEQATTVYARTTGYIKAFNADKPWRVDIGDHVKMGDLLVELDAPEVDAQLDQANAALKQAEAVLAQSKSMREETVAQKEQALAQLGSAKAKLNLAELLHGRMTSLRGSGAVNDDMVKERDAEEKSARSTLASTQASIVTAQTMIDAAQSTIEVSAANVEAAKSAVRRLDVLKSFEKVTAPFDGIITARKSEVGALVTAGSGANSQPLFDLAKTNTVRVYVDVPQSAAPSIKDGLEVQVTLREFPKSVFKGVISRSTHAIDPGSRTLRTEIRVPNADGKLMAGMYAQVKLSVPHQAPPLLLPGSALIVNAAGTQVAIVRGGHVHFQPVVVEADYGASVGISNGLNENDIVIANPSERLVENIAVTTIAATK